MLCCVVHLFPAERDTHAHAEQKSLFNDRVRDQPKKNLKKKQKKVNICVCFRSPNFLVIDFLAVAAAYYDDWQEPTKLTVTRLWMTCTERGGGQIYILMAKSLLPLQKNLMGGPPLVMYGGDLLDGISLTPIV